MATRTTQLILLICNNIETLARGAPTIELKTSTVSNDKEDIMGISEN